MPYESPAHMDFPMSRECTMKSTAAKRIFSVDRPHPGEGGVRNAALSRTVGTTVPLSLNLTFARVCRCSRSQILPGNSRVAHERTTNRSS